MQQYYYNTYSKEYSYFHESINNLILNIIKCVNCGFRQTSVNSTNNLCCSIPKQDGSKTLYNCLDDYFKEEKIEYRCDKCNEINDNIMSKKILDNKDYLIITIKKFDFDTNLGILTKKHDKVTYPLLLNINNYSLVKSNQYKLVSIVNHKGMLNYGHYYSSVMYDNEWYNCNDEYVSNLQISKLHSDNAYILIYKKI